jgi:hypothetical protein
MRDQDHLPGEQYEHVGEWEKDIVKKICVYVLVPITMFVVFVPLGNSWIPKITWYTSLIGRLLYLSPFLVAYVLAVNRWVDFSEDWWE